MKFGKLVAGLLTGVAILSLSACGGNKKDNGESSDGKKEIVISSWDVAGEALKENAEEYEKAHKDVKITIIPSDSTYQKVTPNLISGKGAPDIIHAQARDFSGLLSKFKNQFLDITDQVSDLKKDFTPLAWNSTLDENGKVYGMPWDVGPVAVYYREDYFKEAGIDPNSIKTWDDFIAAGKQLKEKLPNVLFLSDNGATDADMYNILLNQLGGNFVKDNKIDILSPESQKALELNQRFFKEGIMETDAGDVNRFTNGELACKISAVWMAGTFQNVVPDEKGKWKLMPLPAFEEGGNVCANVGGGVLGITTQSKHPKEALDFLKYCLTTTEGQNIMSEKGLFPSYTPYYETEDFKKNNDYFGISLNVFFSELTDAPALNYGTIMPDTSTPLGNALTEIKQGGDVKKNIEKCAQEVSQATQVEINNY